MSILKDQQGSDYCSKNHGVGFARKSVSFCQRDNVHVYDRVQEYETEEIDCKGNNSDKSVNNGKNSPLYKLFSFQAPLLQVLLT